MAKTFWICYGLLCLYLLWRWFTSVLIDALTRHQ